MYRSLIVIHVITSMLFVLVAITVTTRSVAGYYKSRVYTISDKYLAGVFMGLLYLTLVNGGIMFFFIDALLKSSTDVHLALKRASMRFWVVEHFYVMTFALILSQIGRIFILRTTIDRNKFAYASFYYGMTTCITFISMVFYFIYR
jgi:hypothetical protein